MQKLVLISGALANKPLNGGNAWSRLSWVQAFQKLGFKVFFIEQISRDSCVDAAGHPSAFGSSVNLAYFQQVMDKFGLRQSCALVYRDGEEVHGPPLHELATLAREAVLLFNLSGHLTIPEIKQKVPCKVYYDDDPGFTQFWHAANNPGPRLWDHDFYFTIGENIGKPDCSIPSAGISWNATRPPVDLEEWPAVVRPQFDRFTTVASWRGAYGPVTHGGKTYGLKVHEFRKMVDLPQRTGYAFEVALQIHPADKKDLDALLAYGWHISDPQKVANSPEAFRLFVQGSGAECSVAQGIYVDTHSGWFSDRTVRYLASGKPALVQDTGFSRNYPVGEGLVAFRNLAEAMEGAERIVKDYPIHCRAARKVAERFFEGGKVAGELARTIGLRLS